LSNKKRDITEKFIKTLPNGLNPSWFLETLIERADNRIEEIRRRQAGADLDLGPYRRIPGGSRKRQKTPRPVASGVAYVCAP